MTREEAIELMAILKAAYPNSYNGMTKQEAMGVVTVWALQFADMPADIVYIALQKAISDCKFPPSISEVKAKIGKLYWEAYEILSYPDEYPAIAEGERKKYERIEKLTHPYRIGQTYEPTLYQLLPDASRTLGLEGK